MGEMAAFSQSQTASAGELKGNEGGSTNGEERGN